MSGKVDPNKILISGEYAEVVLVDNRGNEKCRTLIDVEDIAKVSQYKWHLHQEYVATAFARGKASPILLHRFLMNAIKGQEVDHINGNKLDNRKSNLRICTCQQNRFNINPIKKSPSGRVGVVWDTAHQRWVAQIQVNHKKYYLGYYRNLGDAITARIAGENKYFGDFAPSRRGLSDTANSRRTSSEKQT